MKQVALRARDGHRRVVDVPVPLVGPGAVLIASAASVVSAGTERATLELARKSLLGKARARPDQVRRVLEKLRADGVLDTIAQVKERLAAPMPLGYATAGTVLAVGAGVQEFRPGDRVASNGPHAGVVCVPRTLCAKVPDGVSLEHGAFATLGAISLQGVRLGGVGLGETVYVLGLGLVGQLCVSLAKAAGCRVLAVDPMVDRCALALRMGADVAAPDLDAAGVMERTGGLGADAVLVAAATESSAPLATAAEAVRSRGRIVVLGATGLDLPRRPLYFKEASVTVSCSYGPGRYDPAYEDDARDYPAAFVRWTAGRNMAAVLEQMARGGLDVEPLVTHRFAIEEAESAYDLVERGGEPHLGIVLTYGAAAQAPPPAAPRTGGAVGARAVRVGCLGAGSFARTVHFPILRRSERVALTSVCSGGGLSSGSASERHGFARAADSEAQVFADAGTDAVFVLTPHAEHARQVVAGLEAGKHVFVEKPLCVTLEELEAIEAALLACGEEAPVLAVGFNRRFAPATREAVAFFRDVGEPLSVLMRFNAGSLDPDHPAHTEREGGRLIGEASHGIDLVSRLVGAPPVRVFAEAVGGPNAPRFPDERCVITLRHANGALSSVAYLAGGDRALEKERVEILGGERAAVIDDFRTLTTFQGGQRHKAWSGRRDKGHAATIDAFLDAVQAGGPAPVPWSEVRAVSLAAILAVRSLREGVPFDVA